MKDRIVEFVVKYPGSRCIACGRVVPVGTTASFDRWTRSFRHRECTSKRREDNLPKPNITSNRKYGMGLS